MIIQVPRSNGSQFINQQQNSEIRVLLIYGSSYLEGQSLDYEFSSNYAHYGSVKISIDRVYTESTLITSELLFESQADVLYLVNLHERILEHDEQTAIISYVQEGHGIVGTHESLNSGQALLAPLFGINPNMILSQAYNVFPISDHMNINDSAHPLFENMPDPYFVDRTMTAAINGKASPWVDDPSILLENGTIRDTSSSGEMAIIYSEGENIRSVYLTHNPSESASSNDLILVYNSFTWSSIMSTQQSPGSPDLVSTNDITENSNSKSSKDATTTIIYTTINKDNETGPELPGVFSDAPIQVDIIFITLLLTGIFYSRKASKR
jgi:hypothetical protein